MLVADVTDVVGVGAKGSQYRIHLVLNLLTLEFISIKITDYHIGESLRHIKYRDDDCVVADRAFCRSDAIFETVESQADVIVRYHQVSVGVWDQLGNRINLAEILRNQPYSTTQSLEVIIKRSSRETRRVWLHDDRMSEKDAVEARRKCRRRNRKSKRGVKEETLLLSEFVIVLTTVPPSQVSCETVLKLYRCRWQVEIVIKRFKSILDAENLRTREGSKIASTWLHGKMLYVLMIEKRSRALGRVKMYRLDEERTERCWRVWKMMRAEMNAQITGIVNWDQQRWKECLRVIGERKRARKLQKLPQEAIEWIKREKPQRKAA